MNVWIRTEPNTSISQTVDSGYIVLSGQCVGSRVWQGSDRAGHVTIVAVSRVTRRHVSLERVAVR